MNEDSNHDFILELTTEIVSSYVSNNEFSAADLPELINKVYNGLNNVRDGVRALSPDRPQPAVPINRSISDDFLVCLEDGKKLKMLKRHLKTAYNMTPQQYRERWGLPADYPMVAPSYAKRRSELAKNIGLGTK
ncbi:MAG: MucR family transcriptional regulator [Alphaproteobacteria bacterium]|nr:MucR family transcriptional regulator [Alphaproteobacteria bacterium]